MKHALSCLSRRHRMPDYGAAWLRLPGSEMLPVLMESALPVLNSDSELAWGRLGSLSSDSELACRRLGPPNPDSELASPKLGGLSSDSELAWGKHGPLNPDSELASPRLGGLNSDSELARGRLGIVSSDSELTWGSAVKTPQTTDFQSLLSTSVNHCQQPSTTASHA